MVRTKGETAEQVLRDWTSAMTYTVATRNLEEHMDLISRSVNVFGMPNRQIIDYKGWRARRHNEFLKGLLQSLVYRDIRVINSADGQLTANYKEVLKGSDGQRFELDKDATLFREADNKWRLVLEQINNIRPL